VDDDVLAILPGLCFFDADKAAERERASIERAVGGRVCQPGGRAEFTVAAATEYPCLAEGGGMTTSLMSSAIIWSVRLFSCRARRVSVCE